MRLWSEAVIYRDDHAVARLSGGLQKVHGQSGAARDVSATVRVEQHGPPFFAGRGVNDRETQVWRTGGAGNPPYGRLWRGRRNRWRRLFLLPHPCQRFTRQVQFWKRSNSWQEFGVDKLVKIAVCDRRGLRRGLLGRLSG